MRSRGCNTGPCAEEGKSRDSTGDDATSAFDLDTWRVCLLSITCHARYIHHTTRSAQRLGSEKYQADTPIDIDQFVQITGTDDSTAQHFLQTGTTLEVSMFRPSFLPSFLRLSFPPLQSPHHSYRSNRIALTSYRAH